MKNDGVLMKSIVWSVYVRCELSSLQRSMERQEYGDTLRVVCALFSAYSSQMKQTGFCDRRATYDACVCYLIINSL